MPQKIHQPADAFAISCHVEEPVPHLSTPRPEDRVGGALVSVGLTVGIHQRVIDVFVLVCFVLLVRIGGRR